jgi:hypothetical protein
MKIEVKIIKDALENAIQTNPQNALTLIQVYRHLDEMDALEKKQIEEDMTFFSSKALEVNNEKAIDEYHSIQTQLDFGISLSDMNSFLDGYLYQGNVDYIKGYKEDNGINQLDRMKLSLERSRQFIPELVKEVVEIIKIIQTQG